jgi:uncharacterized protein with ATP-grasp and redox domains
MNSLIMADKYTQTLIDNGVSENIARKVSEIIEKDDPSKEHLGRTIEEQDLVNQAVQQVNTSDSSE